MKAIITKPSLLQRIWSRITGKKPRLKLETFYTVIDSGYILDWVSDGDASTIKGRPNIRVKELLEMRGQVS